MNAQPSLASLAPPLEPKPQSSFLRQALAHLLSLCLGLFMTDAVISLLDDTLIVFLDVHILTMIRGIVFAFALLLALVTYGLMGLTPLIPKRLFLPVTLFNPLVMLGIIPVAIYWYSRMQQVAWIISACQVVFGLWILYRVRGRLTLRWPLIAEHRLVGRSFSWRNCLVFLLANLFVLPPAIVAFLVLCAALAIGHLSDGFVALRPSGLKVQVRKYIRPDGKLVQLIPMSHIAEPNFYRKLSQSFPSNSIILMEGVTDKRNLLTNQLSYKRMAETLGLAEQEEEFTPIQGEIVMADADVEQFTTNTIGILNLVMLVHAKGVNADTVLKVMQYCPPPDIQRQLFEDLLRLRNRQLLKSLQVHLAQSENFMVPWGTAHMPEIAREIQKLGFHLDETQEHTVMRFQSRDSKNKATGKGETLEKPE